MLYIDRNKLIPVIHKLIKQGGFAGRIGEAALLADETNLELLVNTFPKLFIEGQALENQWTQQLSTSKTAKTARLKLVWNS
jgi:hypothetical protein